MPQFWTVACVPIWDERRFTQKFMLLKYPLSCTALDVAFSKAIHLFLCATNVILHAALYMEFLTLEPRSSTVFRCLRSRHSSSFGDLDLNAYSYTLMLEDGKNCQCFQKLQIPECWFRSLHWDARFVFFNCLHH